MRFKTREETFNVITRALREKLYHHYDPQYRIVLPFVAAKTQRRLRRRRLDKTRFWEFFVVVVVYVVVFQSIVECTNTTLGRSRICREGKQMVSYHVVVVVVVFILYDDDDEKKKKKKGVVVVECDERRWWMRRRCLARAWERTRQSRLIFKR